MSSVADHYETHLAPIYSWMAGGFEHALSLGTAELAEFLGVPGYAIDLGAGFGMHSIPLARAGFRVLALDTSAHLLEQLRDHGAGLQLSAVQADLRNFTRHAAAPADLILCMGDTLTHLQSTDDLAKLLCDVAASLCTGGRFLATVRDYSKPALGDQRFVLVRSDSQRIHTCFLESMSERVAVHDIVHEFTKDGWSMKVSSYEKLRLTPDRLVQVAEDAGLHCQCRPGPRGMVTLLAHT